MRKARFGTLRTVSLCSLLDCLDEFEPHWRLVSNIKHCTTESVNVLWRYLWFLGHFQKKCPWWTKQRPLASTCVHGPKSVRTCFTCSDPQPSLVFDRKHRKHCLCECLNVAWYYLWLLGWTNFGPKMDANGRKWTQMDADGRKMDQKVSTPYFFDLNHKKGLFSTLGPCFSPLPCVFPFKLI